MIRTFLCGKQDHESTDTEKDVNTKGSTVQKTDMFQHYKKRGNAAQRLYTVKFCRVKIILSVHVFIIASGAVFANRDIS